ncbi:MAG: hypothetical protein F4X20_00410 [Dehalococcoidia bacterium]|nr:hypothetical protein [Dehalococcoidia bacterium]
MADVETAVQALKETASAHEGRNIVDRAFAREVDTLLDGFYADITQLKRIELQSLFDLFLLKALYIDRHSTSIATLDYLGSLLARHVRMREIFPIPDLAAHFGNLLESLMEEAEHGAAREAQNLFEANRNIADSTLFLIGIFPASLTGRRSRWRRRRSPAMQAIPRLDISYYTRLGRSHYALASEHELARWTGLDGVLSRLSNNFDIYAEVLSEVAQTFIHGVDVQRVTNLMLDSYNAWRRTGDPQRMEELRKYAALLALDPRRAFSRLRRRQRYVLLDQPGQ